LGERLVHFVSCTGVYPSPPMKDPVDSCLAKGTQLRDFIN
jgi:hypothetical protein